MSHNDKQLNVRNSSIEALRIMAIIMIIFHHFSFYGGFEWGTPSISIPRLWYNFIFMGGKIGVNLFVFISGYYLINDNGRVFRLNKIAKLVGQVLFYSLVIYMIGGMIGAQDLGVSSLIKACFPITFSRWWFVSTYFVLYLLHPFLNKLLHSMDKSMYQTFLLVLVTFWSVIPTFTSSSYEGNSLLWFATLYSISGYIRLYGLNNKFSTMHYFIFWLICSFLSYISSVVFTILGTKWEFFASHTTYFFGESKITTLLISLNLFMIFATLKMNYHKWINTFASASFGVYLIHDNSLIRNFLWTELFKNAHYQESLLLIPYSIMVVAIVYLVCSFIDLFRQHMIEKPFMIIVKRYSEKKTIPFEKYIVLLKDFVFGK